MAGHVFANTIASAAKLTEMPMACWRRAPVIASAMPGTRTAQVAGETATALTAAVRAAATDLDQLARALTTAARDYRVVEQVTAAGIERDGRAAV